MPSPTSDENLLTSVLRAFDIVEQLEKQGGMTMSELAATIDIPPSTAHIYLKTLHEAGYLTRENDEYHLGLRFLKHGGHVRHNLEIYQAAKTELDDLARRTGESVDFGVVEQGKRVLVYKTQGPDVVTQKPVTGDYAHMHMTALGKAMLATLDDDQVSDIVDTHGLPKATQHTIDTREELFDELDRTRERGYSIEDEERRDGIRAIGAAIERGSERPSAISISGPKSQLTDDRLSDLNQAIQDSVNVIQIKLQNY